MRSKTETVWIKHTELNLMYRSQLSLYWLEQIRRSNARFVHFLERRSEGTSNHSQDYGSPSAHLSRKTAFSEKFLDRLVNCHPIDSCLDSLQRERLTGFYCFPQLTLAFAGTSAQHRAGHVAKISGLRVAWKNIEDNQ